MSSRKIRRNQEKKAKKQLEKEVKQKMSMFDRIPESCVACEKQFNKQDRSMVESWRVVVREDEGKVNIYCPDCWDFVQKVIKEYMNGQENAKSDVLIENE